MDKQDYKQMLASMRRELETYLEIQEEFEQKIAQLRQAITSLAPLAKEPELTSLGVLLGDGGLTERIRDILRAVYPNKLPPVEIKEQLKARGQDLSAHKNVMASVHSALRRMSENGEIVTSDEGLTYGWKRKHIAPRRRSLIETGLLSDLQVMVGGVGDIVPGELKKK